LLYKERSVGDVELHLVFLLRVSSLKLSLSTLRLGQSLLPVLVQGSRIVDDSRRTDHTLNKAGLLVLAVHGLSLLVSLVSTALIKLLSTHFHLGFVLLGGLRSFNFTVSSFKIRVDSRFLLLHSRVDVLVGTVHVNSKFSTRFSLMEGVRNWDSRLFTLLSVLHGSHKGFLESTEIRDGLGRSGVEVEGNLHYQALVSVL